MVQRSMAIAGVAAVVGAAALHLYLMRFEAESLGGAPESVVAVARDIALGEIITERALLVRELPEQYVEERHIQGSDLSRVIGTRATAAVPSGSTLLWSDLDVMQSGRTLASLVRPGMRAFPLPKGAASFDGLLKPGDRVDVMVTFGADSRSGSTSTLLQNVLVLTVGSDLGAAVRDRVVRSAGNSVTLSVTQAEAEQLASTEGHARMRLSLRNPADLVIGGSTRQTASDGQQAEWVDAR